MMFFRVALLVGAASAAFQQNNNVRGATVLHQSNGDDWSRLAQEWAAMNSVKDGYGTAMMTKPSAVKKATSDGANLAKEWAQMNSERPDGSASNGQVATNGSQVNGVNGSRAKYVNGSQSSNAVPVNGSHDEKVPKTMQKSSGRSESQNWDNLAKEWAAMNRDKDSSAPSTAASKSTAATSWSNLDRQWKNSQQNKDAARTESNTSSSKSTVLSSDDRTKFLQSLGVSGGLAMEKTRKPKTSDKTSKLQVTTRTANVKNDSKKEKAVMSVNDRADFLKKLGVAGGLASQQTRDKSEQTDAKSVQSSTYDMRNDHVTAASDAQSSRWGVDEVTKTRQHDAVGSLHPLDPVKPARGSSDNSRANVAVMSASERASFVQKMNVQGSLYAQNESKQKAGQEKDSQTSNTNVYSTRGDHVIAAAAADSSRWGVDEVTKTQDRELIGSLHPLEPVKPARGSTERRNVAVMSASDRVEFLQKMDVRGGMALEKGKMRTVASESTTDRSNTHIQNHEATDSNHQSIGSYKPEVMRSSKSVPTKVKTQVMNSSDRETFAQSIGLMERPKLADTNTSRSAATASTREHHATDTTRGNMHNGKAMDSKKVQHTNGESVSDKHESHVNGHTSVNGIELTPADRMEHMWGAMKTKASTIVSRHKEGNQMSKKLKEKYDKIKDENDTAGITERIMKSIPEESQAGGAGGQSTWKAFQKAEENWARLREMKAPNMFTTVDVPKFVLEEGASGNIKVWAKLKEQENKQLDFDVVISGGTLGIFFATALQLKGHRVCVLEAGKLQGREQEWNISMDEMIHLKKLGVLTQEDIDAVITTEFPSCRAGFKNEEVSPLKGGYFENKVGYECVVDDVLNLGVAPGELIKRVAKRFTELGGVVKEESRLRAVHLARNVGTGFDLGEDVEPITGRLMLDCMGNASPISRQQRKGEKPDGVCAVVGSCASGYEKSTNLIGDIIYTNTPIADKKEHGQYQYFWETFPVGIGRNGNEPGSSDTKTTYMFTYMDAHQKRVTLEALMEDYWRLLPLYQTSIKDPEKDLQFKRVLFAYFPTYRSSPLKPAWDRILAVGDASGIQSPLSFGGFGALTRHLDRISSAVSDALEYDLLTKEYLGEINAYTPNLSAAWMFQKAMSVRIGQKADPAFVNRLLAVNFDVMDKMGVRTIKPFLQDVVRPDGLSGSLVRSFIEDPLYMPQIVSHVGIPALVDWLGHVSMMSAYAFLDNFFSPVFSPILESTLRKGESKFIWRRRFESWKYGSGNDYTLPAKKKK